MKSYYEILGVSNNADAVTIKKAYRDLVKKYHPDIYKGDDRDTKFQEIQKAYDVLSDEDKRASYDRNGHASYERSEKYGSSGFSGSYQDFSEFAGFNRYNTVNLNEIPLWKKILFFIFIALIAIFILAAFIIFTIVRFIANLIKQIFN